MTAVQTLATEVARLWAPPPRQTLSEWARENYYLSTGAEKGRLKPKSFQIEPLDSVTDPRVHTVVIMSATQMLKTTVILVGTAHVIAKDPDPIMSVFPRDDDVKKFSKFRLAPMLRDVPALKGKVSDSKARDSQSTIDVKDFPGGPLILTAAGSPGNLAAFPVRYLFCDEIDKFPASAGSEGDPISLAKKRTATYRTRAKLILTCSPTVAGHSRIEKAYADSDQRAFLVPCPSCGLEQILKWAQVQWDSSLPRERQAASAAYRCECGAQWNDVQRWRAVEAGHWQAREPFRGVAGFWISELYSPWKTLADIVADFLEKKDDPEQLKTFVNTSLAEVWQERGEAPDWKRLYDRRESYEIGVVPRGALFLTAAVDVQGDRLEFELKGWGRNKKENWSIFYAVIKPTRRDSDGKIVECRSSDPEPWAMLAEFVARDWPVEGGGTMPIWAMAVDTGYAAETVYNFCRKYPQPAHGPTGSRVHSPRTVVPIKGGHSAFKLVEGVSDTDAARKRRGLKIVTFGAPNAKQQVYDALRLESPIDVAQTYPPGYCHHPQYEAEYFKGLCAETRLVKPNGEIVWRKDGRNEPLDLHAYHLGTAALCGIDRLSESDWNALESRVEQGRIAAQVKPLLSRPTGTREVRGRFV